MERISAQEFQRRYGIATANPLPQPRPVAKRIVRDEPLEAAQAEEVHHGRFQVIITSHRRRLLDEDNLAGKFHCDLLRYSGIIPSDAPDQTTISNRQVKVKKKEEEKTVITIIYPV